MARLAEEMHKDNPDNIYALEILGESLEKRGRIAEAIERYEQALSTDSQKDHPVGHVGFSGFLKRLDILYYRAGAYAECLRVNLYYTGRHPNNDDAWNRLWRAAQKTDHPELAAEAEARTKAIRASREAARQARDAQAQRFRELYTMELAALCFPTEDAAERSGEPSPPYEASAEEWGAWLLRTTDMDRIDAQQTAMSLAWSAMAREQARSRPDAHHPMTAEARAALVAKAIERVPECARGGFITLADASNDDNWVQLTDRYVNVPLRDWPTATRRKLQEIGFFSSNGANPLDDTLCDHTAMSPDALLALVLDLFTILEIPPTSEIIVDFEDV